MSYDLHIVRTKHWVDAASNPITKEEVDALIAQDPELEWSTSDYLEMRDDAGNINRHYAILWRGYPCFYFYRHGIECAGPDEAQQTKMIQMATTLKAYAVGDEGERYELHKSFFGKPKIVMIEAGG